MPLEYSSLLFSKQSAFENQPNLKMAFKVSDTKKNYKKNLEKLKKKNKIRKKWKKC